MANGRIAIDPVLLMSQSAEMTKLTEEFDHLFGSVTSALGTMNSRWSANLSNNFITKITSAKSVFSALTDLLHIGAQAASTSASDFLSLDNSLEVVANSVKSDIGKLLEQGEILYDYWKDRSAYDVIMELLNKYKKAGDETGDINEILSQLLGVEGDFFDKLPGHKAISSLVKLIRITDFEDMSPEGIVSKIKDGYTLMGGKDMLAAELGVGGAEAGLVIDLVAAYSINYTENMLENVNLVHQMLTDENMSFADRMKVLGYVANNGMNKAEMEGFRDVVFDKADAFGLISGANKYIKANTGGEFSKVSEVYFGYFDEMKRYASENGVGEMLKLNAESFVETLQEPWFGWKDFLHL